MRKLKVAFNITVNFILGIYLIIFLLSIPFYIYFQYKSDLEESKRREKMCEEVVREINKNSKWIDKKVEENTNIYLETLKQINQ